MSEDNEELDPTNEEVDDTEKVAEETPDETPVEEEQPDVPKLQESNKKLFTRAKKAEAEAKKAKEDLAEALKANAQPKSINPAESLSPEDFAKEVRLLSTLSDEEIAEAKDIAKGKDISLEKALQTKAFLAFQKELKEEQRKEKAKLNSSKGSQVQQPQKIGALERDDHKALVMEKMANVR